MAVNLVNDIDKLLEYSWKPEVAESIMKMKSNLKNYSFLLTKSTLKDISDVIQIAIISKIEINTLQSELYLIKDENLMLKDELKKLNCRAYEVPFIAPDFHIIPNDMISINKINKILQESTDFLSMENENF